jgi:hypothetical protein
MNNIIQLQLELQKAVMERDKLMLELQKVVEENQKVVVERRKSVMGLDNRQMELNNAHIWTRAEVQRGRTLQSGLEQMRLQFSDAITRYQDRYKEQDARETNLRREIHTLRTRLQWYEYSQTLTQQQFVKEPVGLDYSSDHLAQGGPAASSNNLSTQSILGETIVPACEPLAKNEDLVKMESLQRGNANKKLRVSKQI